MVGASPCEQLFYVILNSPDKILDGHPLIFAPGHRGALMCLNPAILSAPPIKN